MRLLQYQRNNNGATSNQLVKRVDIEVDPLFPTVAATTTRQVMLRRLIHIVIGTAVRNAQSSNTVKAYAMSVYTIIIGPKM